MKTAALAIAMVLSILDSPAAAQGSSDAIKMDDLLEQGLQVIAEGQLLEMNEWNCYSLRVISDGSSRSCSHKVIYGWFKKLKGETDEFVCLSFRAWTCFRSEVRN